jgi:hypothetical protein
MMPDGIPKIIGLSYASMIYKALAELNFGDHSNECQIGRNDFHGNFHKYERYFKSRKGMFTLEADVKRHDAATSEIVMVVAFGLIRSMFPPDDRTDRRFLYMMSGTIYKNLLVPGRFIYKLLKSIPTGSPFTSILTTLVNWLNWSYLLENEFGWESKKFKMNLFGDDTIVHLPDFCLRKEEWWIQKFKSLCGYDLDPCEVRSFHDSDWTKRPSFLKTIPKYGMPARLSKDLLLSLSFTRRRNKGPHGYVTQVSGTLYNSPFNMEATNFGFKMRTYLWRYCFDTDSDVYKWKLSKVRRKIEDNFSWRVASSNYTLPLVYNYESTKNVDLGNKPKYVQPGGNIYMKRMSTDFANMYFKSIGW